MYGGQLSFRSIGRTHTGKVRPHNEDAFLERTDIGLWVVADGMGGHRAGDVASAMIIDRLAAVKPPVDGRSFLREVREDLYRVNDDLYTQGSAQSQARTMGSTVVAVLIYQDFYACLWVGDSRLYRLRRNQLSRLTRDHSFVQQLVDAGEISAADASHHPMRNVVTRALGAHAHLDVDTCHGPIEAGDRLILATDGVTGVCSDTEIALMAGMPDLTEAAERIEATCLERGAPDNLSFVIIEAEA
ncbi:MAG: SpoIIE family protein phosphatase [Alphaproteobacteria bacterium]|nr:SpoIIE family protein phosphatase [Alphaproteobacteria bacterium]